MSDILLNPERNCKNIRNYFAKQQKGRKWIKIRKIMM